MFCSFNVTYVTQMSYLKVLSKLFSKLLRAETNLCVGDCGMIGIYESYSCFPPIIIILKDPIIIISQKLTLHITKVCTPQFGFR